MRAEHEVELARVREGPPLAAGGALVRVVELVEPVAGVAVPAVDQRVGERGDVARRLPDLRRLDHRRVETDDVVTRSHHGMPPLLLDVAEQLDAERSVVVRRAEAAVDLRRLEDEAALLGEVDDGVEVSRHESFPGTLVEDRSW